MRSDPKYLLERAAQLRRIARTCDVLAAAKMLGLAVELEARAATLISKKPKSPLSPLGQ